MHAQLDGHGLHGNHWQGAQTHGQLKEIERKISDLCFDSNWMNSYLFCGGVVITSDVVGLGVVVVVVVVVVCAGGALHGGGQPHGEQGHLFQIKA